MTAHDGWVAIGTLAGQALVRAASSALYERNELIG